MDQATTPEQTFPVTPAVSVPIDFQNQRPQFRRMVLRGALLELITIGFYRFWLATNIRRHIWHSTSVGGDALEYTGNAKELFLGALLALAIFLPVYLIYFLIGIEAERWKAFASTPFILFFYLFAQFAVYRARRYRLTRTIWRGVRFWMTGSGWDYAWRSALWMLLALVTLGLALPWREAALERFKMRHSHYGDLQGSFEGTGWEFFKQGILLWLAIPGLILIGAVIAGVVGVAINAWKGSEVAGVVGTLVFQILFWFSAPFIYGAFKAIQWRWWVSGVRFGEVSFVSTIRAADLMGLYWKVIGWSVLISIVIGLVLTIIFASIAVLSGIPGTIWEKILAVGQQGYFAALPLVSYVLLFLLITAVARIYLVHDVVARVAASSFVYNITTAEDVAARGAAANAVGEGLADSLEIFGF